RQIPGIGDEAGAIVVEPRTVAAVSAETVYASKTLARFLSLLFARPAAEVVDLGPVIGSNITFLGERVGCKMHVEHLYADVARPAAHPGLKRGPGPSSPPLLPLGVHPTVGPAEPRHQPPLRRPRAVRLGVAEVRGQGDSLSKARPELKLNAGSSGGSGAPKKSRRCTLGSNGDRKNTGITVCTSHFTTGLRLPCRRSTPWTPS